MEAKSPRTCTRCHCGQLHHLGDEDCGGVVVGWIDETGCTWESETEHDTAVSSSRYQEAWDRWNRSGGLIPKPDPQELAQKHCRNPDNVEAAVEVIEEVCGENDPLLPLVLSRRAQQARLN